jgi:two-component system phosphate regulon sensor histidine kinase PhoR
MLASGRVPTEEKRAQYLSTIVRESERLSALIENVLDFARVERGKKVAYEFADADLGALVARAVEACRYRADTEGMRIDLVTEPEVFARVDERAVQLAVINLVENAVKYAPGSDVVTVTVGREGDAAVVRVRDRGPGIPKEDRERVFVRFDRGKQPEGRPVRGSGIGLSLVASVMEAHRGDVRVEEGEGGVGAAFVLTFPFEGPPPSSSVG